MPEELLELRAELNKLDSKLVALLSDRFKVTKKVGQLKARENLPPADPARENEMYERLGNLAKDKDVSPELIKAIMQLIIEEVKVQHRKLSQPSNQ